MSDFKKQRISDFKSLGLTQREIAKRINRFRSVIKTFLKLGLQKYGKKKTFRKAKKKISDTQKRAVLREMSKTGASSSQVCARFQLNISSSTVRKWFGKSNDCFVLDRGFRDSTSSMRSKGFVVKMPSFKGAKRNQLTCEESNNS